MDIKFFYYRLRYLMLYPEKAWRVIDDEKRPLRYMQRSYFFPIITITSLAAVIGALFFKHGGLTYFYPLFLGIRYFLFFLVTAWLTALILNEATKALDLGKDFSRAFKLTAFSLAPLYICMTASLLFESLLFVNLLALYGIYLLWLGIEQMINPPDHKKAPLMIAIVVAFAIIYYLSYKILNFVVIDLIYFTIFR